MSSSENSEMEKYPFRLLEPVDNIKKIRMTYNVFEALVVNNKIYAENKNHKMKAVYSFNGIEKVWYASDIERSGNKEQPSHRKEAYLIRTNDSKYITNVRSSIIEFSLQPGYEIIGYCMKYEYESYYSYNVCFIVEETSSKLQYFVYRSYESNGLTCILIKYEKDGYVFKKTYPETDERYNEDDECIRPFGPFENGIPYFCNCYECNVGANTQELIDMYFNLIVYDDDYKRYFAPYKLLNPFFIKDYKLRYYLKN